MHLHDKSTTLLCVDDNLSELLFVDGISHSVCRSVQGGMKCLLQQSTLRHFGEKKLTICQEGGMCDLGGEWRCGNQTQWGLGLKVNAPSHSALCWWHSCCYNTKLCVIAKKKKKKESVSVRTYQMKMFLYQTTLNCKTRVWHHTLSSLTLILFF